MFTKGQHIRCIDNSGLSAMEYPPGLGEVFKFLEVTANGPAIRIITLEGGVMVGVFAPSRFQDADLPWKKGSPAPKPAPVLPFSGPAYSPASDHARLLSQHLTIFNLMKDGKPRTLAQIEDKTGYPTASVSAQLRNLRKTGFGAHTITKERVKTGSGTWIYTLTPNSDAITVKA